MTRYQKALRFIGVLAAMFGFLVMSESFVMLHQGEDQTAAGFIIIWLAKAGTLGLAISIALVSIDPKRALRLLCMATACATPLLIMYLLPNSWCLVLQCGDDFAEFVWEPALLLPLVSLAIAIVGIHYSNAE